ncbi:MAG: hypothetical protein K9W44_17050 [Candidatus Lokiarchaeota archaeon]|nr:hypothetical protein [Candidatus Harpocratesius repetitus]
MNIPVHSLFFARLEKGGSRIDYITNLGNFKETDRQSYIFEWELIHLMWLSLASIYENIDDFHEDIDYLLENKLSSSEKQQLIKEQYLSTKVGDEHYYVPPTSLPDPKIIIGATKNNFAAKFIQCGKQVLEGLDSSGEVEITKVMLSLRRDDGSFDMAQLGTFVKGQMSPYAVIKPQFMMDLWDPIKNEWLESESEKGKAYIIRYKIDWIVMENMLWLVKRDGDSITWRDPGIFGVGLHGAKPNDFKYWKRKALRVWTSHQNDLSIINIFTEGTEAIKAFQKQIDEIAGNEEAHKQLVCIMKPHAEAFFALRNLPEMRGMTIKELITEMAEWLREVRLQNDFGARFYGYTQTTIENIVKSFGVLGEKSDQAVSYSYINGEKIEVKHWVPYLDDEGHIAFNSEIKDWYDQIEQPHLMFQDPNKLKMLQQVYRYYLTYIEELRYYYGQEAEEDPAYNDFLSHFDNYIAEVTAFVSRL